MCAAAIHRQMIDRERLGHRHERGFVEPGACLGGSPDGNRISAWSFNGISISVNALRAIPFDDWGESKGRCAILLGRWRQWRHIPPSAASRAPRFEDRASQSRAVDLLYRLVGTLNSRPAGTTNAW